MCVLGDKTPIYESVDRFCKDSSVCKCIFEMRIKAKLAVNANWCNPIATWSLADQINEAKRVKKKVCLCVKKKKKKKKTCVWFHM